MTTWQPATRRPDNQKLACGASDVVVDAVLSFCPHLITFVTTKAIDSKFSTKRHYAARQSWTKSQVGCNAFFFFLKAQYS